jgi:predicted secreted protein
MMNLLSLATILVMLSPFQNSEPNRVSSRSYVVKENEFIKIELLANPSTGYAWFIAKRGGRTCVDSVGHAYNGVVGMPSVGGKEIWEFKGVSRGTTTLTFYYKRPWEQGKPALVKEIVVEVN